MKNQQLKQHIERVKRERAVTVTAPSGLQYRVVRPNMAVYLDGGRLPESFVLLMNRVAANEVSADDAEKQMSPEDNLAYSKFVVSLIRECVVEPRIVNHPTDDDDELDVGDVAAIGDFDFLSMYLSGLVPDQPVKTKEGDTSVESLEAFRDQSEGQLPAEPGSDRAEVQPSPV